MTLIDDLQSFFELDERPDILPRYNIAPSQEIVVVRQRPDGARWIDRMQWGLAGTRRPGGAAAAGLTINARSETVDRKPLFRRAFRRARCLVPADGFYEWEKRPSGRQPFHIRLRDGGLFAFAGLWETERTPQGEEFRACAILTADANPLVANIHDRMPVMLTPRSFGLWLIEEAPLSALKALLRPYPEELMTAQAVSRTVNSPFNDSPDCLKPPPDLPRQSRLF